MVVVLLRLVSGTQSSAICLRIFDDSVSPAHVTHRPIVCASLALELADLGRF